MNNKKIRTYDELDVDEKEVLDSFRQMKLLYDHARFKYHRLQVENLINDYETLTSDAIRFHTDLQLKRAQQHVYRCLNFNQSQLHQYDEKKFIKDWN